MNVTLRSPAALLLAGVLALLAGCERPPIDSVQRGYRGTGMAELANPRIAQQTMAANQSPETTPPLPAGGPPASAVFKNVQVLGDLSVGEFTRTMVAITNWVSPDQGCAYCHAPGEDLASDSLYTKVVARRMLVMNRHINSDWKSHVADTGVTCFTCHRGQPVPANVWFRNTGPSTAANAGNRAGQNTPAPQVGLTSLPYDPFTPFLDQANEIRVVSTSALPTNNHHSIKQTEWTYALMMNMSQALGVNCTYCHNTRSFASWDNSTPQRETAWYGIRMVRDLNKDYLDPLGPTLPPIRHGPMGDGPKVECATCHNGVFKPLYGVSMLKDYPALVGRPGSGKGVAAGALPADPTQAVAVVSTDLVKFYFATGRFELPANAAAILDALAKAHPGQQLVISGYHDAQGSLAQNEELAKQRAMAVRDQLRQVGIGDQRIVLMKPEQAQVAGGSDNPEARRVEVSLK